MSKAIISKYSIPNPKMNWEEYFRPDGKPCMNYSEKTNPNCQRVALEGQWYCESCLFFLFKGVDIND